MVVKTATCPAIRSAVWAGLVQQDQELQCGATVEGTSWLMAHRLTNLQASRNQSAQQVSQATSVHILYHCKVWLSPFCAESLCLVHTVPVEWGLSKSWLSLWSESSAKPCWVCGVKSQQILAELGGIKAQGILAEFVEPDSAYCHCQVS